MFTLTLVTPQKKIEANLEVEEVIVPAYRGQLGILPGHAPLMTTLSIGQLKYKPAGSSDYKKAVISWGYCEVFPGGVNILAETAETLEDIDLERVDRAIKLAQEKLSLAGLPSDEITKYQLKYKRAMARKDMSR